MWIFSPPFLPPIPNSSHFIMAKLFKTHKATCKLYCFKAVCNAKTHFGKRGKKKKDCTVHYIPISKKWYNFLWFDCPYVWVYVSQYNMVFSLHLLSVSADTKAFQVPIGHFGIYIAFPLLRFQALLGIERIFRWIRFRKKWWRTKYCWNLKNMSSLHFLSSFSIICAKALWGLKVEKILTWI